MPAKTALCFTMAVVLLLSGCGRGTATATTTQPTDPTQGPPTRVLVLPSPSDAMLSEAAARVLAHSRGTHRLDPTSAAADALWGLLEPEQGAEDLTAWTLRLELDTAEASWRSGPRAARVELSRYSPPSRPELGLWYARRIELWEPGPRQ